MEALINDQEKGSFDFGFVVVGDGRDLRADSERDTLRSRARRTKGGIPRATVKVNHIATGKTRTISTDTAGRYSFTNLEPGSYELRVEASGYKVTLQSGLTLTVGGALVADGTMSVGPITERVTIEAREHG